jgi:hypothetical protein
VTAYEEIWISEESEFWEWPAKDDNNIKPTENPLPDSNTVAADLEIVKDMRQSIIKVLSLDLSPAQNQQPQEWD